MKIPCRASATACLAMAGVLIASALVFAPIALGVPRNDAAVVPAATDTPDGEAPQEPPNEPQDEDGQDGATPPPDETTQPPDGGEETQPPGTPDTEGPPGTGEGSRTASETTTLPTFEANLPFTGGKPVGFWILGGLLMLAGAATLTAPKWLHRTGRA